MKQPSPFFLSSLKEWMVTNYKLLFLSLLIACVSLPKYDLFYSSGIDESLPWVYNYFADGHYALSQYLLFPHGRLAFILYPLNLGNNIAVAVSITVLCSVMFSMNLFRLAFLKKQSLTAATCLLLIIHAVADIQFLLIGLTFSNLLLYHASKQQERLIFAVFFCVLSLYIKSYCAVMCNVILASELIYILVSAKTVKPVAMAVLAFVLFFVAGWLALYQSLGGIFTFLRGQAELASDNSEAVSLYTSHDWWLIGTSFIALIFLRLFARDGLAKHFFLIMLAALFAAWKHAMARSDSIHMGTFMGFLVFFVFTLFLISGELKARSLIAGIISIAAFGLIVPVNGNLWSRELFKPTQLYNLCFNFKPFIKEKDKISQNYTSDLHLPDTIRRFIGKHTADVYPWNYSIIAKNNLNWQPRPVLQSYAAYTSWLDKQDADHFESGNTARFYIWELKKTMHIRPMEGIDGHYLLNDEPQAMLAFFRNYTLRYKDENYLVYEKRQAPVAVQYTALTKTLTLKHGQWMEVPECDPGCVMRVKLGIKKNITGKLVGFLYKGEGFFMSYQFENGSEQENRIVPKNAKEGLWLYPFINDPVSDTLESKIVRIKIRCTDNLMIDEDYNVEFEQVRFNFEKTSSGFAEEAFHKTRK